MPENVKQVIVVRSDLKMNKGKIAGQVAHASLAIILDRMKIYWPFEHRTLWLKKNDPMEQWLSKRFTKVILKCNGLEELENIYRKALNLKIPASIITDRGDTVFSEPTTTCCAIGPDYNNRIDSITGHLRLL